MVTEGLSYKLLDNDTYEVSVGTATTATEIIIPSMYEGKAVTSIGNYAFQDCSSLTSITIPNSVTGVGAAAFWGCRSLASVEIPRSVKSIGEEAFYNCNGLTSITIGKGVTNIRDWAFAGCESLKSIYFEGTEGEWNAISKENAKIPSSATIRFGTKGLTFTPLDDDTYEVSVGTATNVSSIVIPNTYNGKAVTRIAESAFYQCYDLMNIVIPDSVTSIGDSAFRGCSSLTVVTIGDGVTIIGDDAFWSCHSLTSITIPNSVTRIGNSAFYDCEGLTSVTIPDGVKHIEVATFASCSNLATVVMGNNVSSIGRLAFWGCRSLTSVTIPDSVTIIGEEAFLGCSDLTSIVLPPYLLTIAEGTFSNCSDLLNITIPYFVATIGTKAFANCDKLSEIYFMGTEAEWNAIKKSEAQIPESATVYCISSEPDVEPEDPTIPAKDIAVMKIQNLIDTSNETTGQNDTSLTAAVNRLKNGYGQGECLLEKGNGEASLVQKVADGETPNTADGKGAVTFGVSGTNNAENAVMYGLLCLAEEKSGQNADGDPVCSPLVGGKECKVRGAYGVSLGRSNEVNARYGAAFNYRNKANGEASAVFGGNSTVNGTSAGSMGVYNQVDATAGVALGSHHKIGKNAHSAVVAGSGLESNYPNQFIGGQFNKNKADTIAEIGNGESKNKRSNAFEVYKDGRVKVYGAPIDNNDVLRKIDVFPVFKPSRIALHDTTNSKAACSATGSASSALGEGLIAKRYGQTVVGTYNDDSSDGSTRFVVGGGNKDTYGNITKFNALMTYADGHTVAGRSTDNSDNGKTLVTKDYLLSKIAQLEARIQELESRSSTL